jgi:hypothetical protein
MTLFVGCSESVKFSDTLDNGDRGIPASSQVIPLAERTSIRELRVVPKSRSMQMLARSVRYNIDEATPRPELYELNPARVTREQPARAALAFFMPGLRDLATAPAAPNLASVSRPF